jgi:mRNA interferase RelE/StbE
MKMSSMSSTYAVRLDPGAAAELRKLDRPAQERIARFLTTRVRGQANPKEQGKPLTGGKVKLWRYRIGAYQVVCHIDDAARTVVVMRIVHRKDVYR